MQRAVQKIASIVAAKDANAAMSKLKDKRASGQKKEFDAQYLGAQKESCAGKAATST
jgi:hypothetical protein